MTTERGCLFPYRNIPQCDTTLAQHAGITYEIFRGISAGLSVLLLLVIIRRMYSLHRKKNFFASRLQVIHVIYLSLLLLALTCVADSADWQGWEGKMPQTYAVLLSDWGGLAFTSACFCICYFWLDLCLKTAGVRSQLLKSVGWAVLAFMWISVSTLSVLQTRLRNSWLFQSIKLLFWSASTISVSILAWVARHRLFRELSVVSPRPLTSARVRPAAAEAPQTVNSASPAASSSATRAAAAAAAAASASSSPKTSRIIATATAAAAAPDDLNKHSIVIRHQASAAGAFSYSASPAAASPAAAACFNPEGDGRGKSSRTAIAVAEEGHQEMVAVVGLAAVAPSNKATAKLPSCIDVPFSSVVPVEEAAAAAAAATTTLPRVTSSSSAATVAVAAVAVPPLPLRSGTAMQMRHQAWVDSANSSGGGSSRRDLRLKSVDSSKQRSAPKITKTLTAPTTELNGVAEAKTLFLRLCIYATLVTIVCSAFLIMSATQNIRNRFEQWELVAQNTPNWPWDYNIFRVLHVPLAAILLSIFRKS